MKEKSKRVFYFNYEGKFKDRGIDVYSTDTCMLIEIFTSLHHEVMDDMYVDDCEPSIPLWDRPSFIRLMKDATSGKIASITTDDTECRDAIRQLSRIEEINEKAS